MENSDFLKTAVKTAFKAGRYIRNNVGKIKSVRYKGDINVVTNIDKTAERKIISSIKKKYPRHFFLAEEGKYMREDTEFTWIIDPLDGTTNFLHGFPFFCVSIALEQKGEMILGVVYDPTRDELFHAEKNKGAYLNHKRVSVSKISVLKKALLSTGFAYNIRSARNNNIANFTKFLKSSQAVRRGGSAAIDLCYVACGRFDGFWELNLHPWDTAAGLIIMEEAGGKVTRFDGSAYNVYDKEILATNSKIHSQMLRLLSKK